MIPQQPQEEKEQNCPNCNHLPTLHSYTGGKCLSTIDREYKGFDGWWHIKTKYCNCKLKPKEIKLNIKKLQEKRKNEIS